VAGSVAVFQVVQDSVAARMVAATASSDWAEDDTAKC
jgi:hypothetical protein